MLISLVVTLRWSSVKCSAWLDSTGWSCPGPWWLVTCYSLLVTRYSLLVTRYSLLVRCRVRKTRKSLPPVYITVN
jgi:hypothetical protein